MSGAIWTRDEVQTLIALLRQGKSSFAIAAALSASSGRTITGDGVRKRRQRLVKQGVDLPGFGGKGGRPPVKGQPSERTVAPVLNDRRRKMLAGPQSQAMRALMARCSYEPAPIIAGFPTIQVRKDIEGNDLAPVTLRRVDLSGAQA